MISTETFEQFFTHPVLADRAGVDVRSVTQQGALCFRVMCFVSAVAWIALPIALARIARRNPQSSETNTTHATTTSTATSRSPWTLRVMLLLLIALVLGLSERLSRISESFWYDEISALIDYAQHGPGPILGTYFVQSNHVLHTLLSWCAMELADALNEPVLRAPAFLAGIASIGAVAALARESAIWQRVPPQPRMAVAFVVAALAPIMVLESVEARGYSMMILAASLASWLLLLGLRTGRTWVWAGYAIACALGTWAHLTFVILPISHGVIAIWLVVRPRANSADRPRAMGSLLALGLAAITSATLLSPLLPDLLRIRSEFQALDGNEPSIFSAEGARILMGLGGAWTAYAAIIPAMLMLAGVLGARHDPARRIPLAATLIGLPFVVIATELAGSWMYARFALFAMPGILLAMTMGVFDVVRFLRGRGLSPTAVTATLCAMGAIVAGLWCESLSSLPPKQPIRDAVAFIREATPEGRLIACAGLGDNVVAYYALIAGFETQNAGAGGSAISTIAPTTDWLIVIYPKSLTDAGRSGLANAWTLMHTFPGWVDWGNGDVLVYHRNSTNSLRN